MAEERPIFLQSDGRPEHRSIDEIPRDAIAGGDFNDLPGRGRPLDWEDYFASGPEHRIGYRLLKDNQLLPEPLQDRKEAEELQQAGEGLLIREAKVLKDIGEEISRKSIPLVTCFLNRQTLTRCLGLDSWPPCFAEPAAGSRPDLLRVLRQIECLQSLISRYNHRIDALILKYLDLLKGANEYIHGLNNKIASTGRFNSSLHIVPLNLSAREQKVRARFPELPPFPEDLPKRIQTYYRETPGPSWISVYESFF